MITEEQITNEAKDYAKSSTIDGRIPYGIEDTEVIQDTFTYGIDWYKKTIWHTLKEKPKEDEQILCKTNDGYILTWTDEDWASKVGIWEIVKWCYTKDLEL